MRSMHAVRKPIRKLICRAKNSKKPSLGQYISTWSVSQRKAKYQRLRKSVSSLVSFKTLIYTSRLPAHVVMNKPGGSLIDSTGRLLNVSHINLLAEGWMPMKLSILSTSSFTERRPWTAFVNQSSGPIRDEERCVAGCARSYRI